MSSDSLFGRIQCMHTAPSLEVLSSMLEGALQDIACLGGRPPHKVSGLEKLARTIQKDLNFLKAMSSHGWIPCTSQPCLGRTDPELPVFDAQDLQAEKRSHTSGVTMQSVCPTDEASTVPQPTHPISSHPQQHSASIASTLQPHSSASQAQLQGILNNLRGFSGELLTAAIAPGVTAVRQRFSRPPPITQHSTATPLHAAEHHTTTCGTGCGSSTCNAAAESCSATRECPAPESGPSSSTTHADLRQPCLTIDTSSACSCPATASTAIHSNSTVPLHIPPHSAAALARVPQPPVNVKASKGSSRSVEVDVVANDGCTWIEVKNQESFGLGSSHFTGTACLFSGRKARLAKDTEA